MDRAQAKPNILFVIEKVVKPTPDAFLILERLSKISKYHFFLEGFEEWDGTSPYSYIGVDPVEILFVRNGEVSYLKYSKSNSDPLNAIKEFSDQYRALPPKKDEPAFRGGAIGYVGYESSKFFESALNKTMKATDGESPEICLMVFKTIVGVAHDKS